ncbi:hypothetical protein K438DRAFT_1962229 [Mycena galopus ATCC 62051]|nr:hypothetical protein K438DRAFT_1962229 [Mycena galopus ATCC 62051]
MSSLFALRLGTNYCPTEEEAFQIQGLLVEPTLRLERLEDEITNPWQKLTMAELAEERDNLDACVKAHRALILPVRKLPLDIIQEITIACLPKKFGFDFCNVWMTKY